MKYVANPVEVDAFKISGVHEVNGVIIKVFCEGREFYISPGMIARMTPNLGDYLVIQADGYMYLNPKAVFERKYSPIEEAQSA